jgi:hypothetical protein
MTRIYEWAVQYPRMRIALVLGVGAWVAFWALVGWWLL